MSSFSELIALLRAPTDGLTATSLKKCQLWTALYNPTNEPDLQLLQEYEYYLAGFTLLQIRKIPHLLNNPAVPTTIAEFISLLQSPSTPTIAPKDEFTPMELLVSTLSTTIRLGLTKRDHQPPTPEDLQGARDQVEDYLSQLRGMYCDGEVETVLPCIEQLVILGVYYRLLQFLPDYHNAFAMKIGDITLAVMKRKNFKTPERQQLLETGRRFPQLFDAELLRDIWNWKI